MTEAMKVELNHIFSTNSINEFKTEDTSWEWQDLVPDLLTWCAKSKFVHPVELGFPHEDNTDTTETWKDKQY